MQAPDEVAREVRGALSASGGRDGGPGCDVHRWVLAVAEQEWRDYVCYLDAELGTLVRGGRVWWRVFRVFVFIDLSLGRKGLLRRRG